jgi:hypothetical protein
MGTPGELQYVVDSLNQPPFEKELTLVTLDEKTPQELLQLLNDVFGKNDPLHIILFPHV